MKNKILLAALFSALFFSCKNSENDKNTATPKPDAILLKQDEATRVEPKNWWIGFKNPVVELLIHRKGIADFDVKLGQYPGVRLVNVSKTGNPNYLFVEISIYATAKPGNLPLIFEKGSEQMVFEYPILAREGGQKGAGVTAKDFVYLLMPDRFANGNPANDEFADLQEPKAHRDSLTGRHGGDLKGISDHLDYFKELGVTALWLNPELENDQPSASYHGYAITDHYKVDRRIGTNEEYRDFVKKCHENGLKVVRDVVINHCGHKHWWMADLPTEDWVNKWDTFTRSSYRAPTLVDPYASERDKKHFLNGWFDKAMPDLNQKNPFLGRYLIQNMIWWIEYAGIDGLRTDTYTYSDQGFMSKFNEAVRKEYPDISNVGEVWENAVGIQSYFADNQPVKKTNFDSNLPGMIDFQLNFAIQEALTREQSWTEGASKIYYVLAQDNLYEDPMKNLIFLDNHDMTRIFGVVGQNMDKFKSGIVWLLTERGVPQLYYGTELLFTGDANKSHGLIRQEMPGAWPGDKRSVFTAEGRTAAENEAFDFVKKMAAIRKANPILQTGKLMQFTPENSVYCYFRYDEMSSVMVILNTANSDKKVDLRRFAERFEGYKSAKNALTDEVLTDLTASVSVKKNSPLVLILGK